MTAIRTEKPKRIAWTPTEAAQMLGVSPCTVRQAIRDGRVRVTQIGLGKQPKYRIPDVEVRRIAVEGWDPPRTDDS